MTWDWPWKQKKQFCSPDVGENFCKASGSGKRYLDRPCARIANHESRTSQDVGNLQGQGKIPAASLPASPDFSLPPLLFYQPASLSTLDHLHQVDIRRVYSGVCNCILSPVLHYQPWKWNLIIPDQFLMYKMIWPRFKGSHNWNQVNDTCSIFQFLRALIWFFPPFHLWHRGRRLPLFFFVSCINAYILSTPISLSIDSFGHLPII